MDGAKRSRAGANRDARWQDGCMRNASLQGHAFKHDEVSLAKGPVAIAIGPLGGDQCREITGKYSRRVRELACEIANRPGIDLALVPLLEHAKIRAAGLPV